MKIKPCGCAKTCTELLVKHTLAQKQELEVLLELMATPLQDLDVSAHLQRMAEYVQTLVSAETVFIPIIDDARGTYTYLAAVGKNAEEIRGAEMPREFGICGWVWKNNKAWWRGTISDLPLDDRLRWEADAGTAILVPLPGRSRLLGGITALNKLGGEEFTEKDYLLLKAFAAHAAIVLENATAMADLMKFQASLSDLNRQLQGANAEMAKLSLYDRLTGLPNRTLVHDRLKEQLARSRRAALILIDVDRFQDINDTWGHDAGDAVLTEVAARLRKVLPETTTVARMGGDEFLIVLQNKAHLEGAIQKIQGALQVPLNVAGVEAKITISAGMVSSPEHGKSFSTLLQHADMALYTAKKKRGSACFFEPGMQSEVSGRLAMANDVRKAVEANDFYWTYQPKLAIKDGVIVGFEALARWRHPEMGFVAPDVFIPVMESLDLLLLFSQKTLEAAAQQSNEWASLGWDVRIAVNVPVSVVVEPLFLALIRETVPRLINPSGLVIEITENVFMSGYENLLPQMETIRGLGLEFSIDDFGTGFSSLSRLQKLPVGEVKIDKSFVMNLERNVDDQMIVKSTIQLAANLGLDIVAEGVESEEALSQLAAWNCSIAQGYYISRPLEAADVVTWLGKAIWPIQKRTTPW